MNNKNIDLFLSKINEEEKNFFSNPRNLGVSEKITLCKTFPDLVIPEEELHLMYHDIQNEIIILISSENIYFKNKSGYTKTESLKNFKGDINKNIPIPIPHILIIEKFIQLIHSEKINFQEESKSVIKNIFDTIVTTLEKTSSLLQNVAEEASESLPKISVAKETPQIIATEYSKENVNKLLSLGTDITSLLPLLDTEYSISKSIEQLRKEGSTNIATPLMYILIYDVLSMYAKSTSKFKDFHLVYACEKLQKKEVLATYTPELIQKINASKGTENYVLELQKLQIIDVKETYKNQFLFPILVQENEKLKPIIQKIYLQLFEIFEISNEENIQNIQTPAAIKSAIVIEEKNAQTLEEVMLELNELIGLDNIKKAVLEFVDFLKVQKMREEKGLKPINNSLHAVFIGPPGTGKTTIARILSKIYAQLGFLKKGHLVETDRSGLVAGYVGQTAIKTDEIITKALDGVLFIDEAYSLAKSADTQSDFGNEAIEILLKRMEDNRSNFVVIVAGYTEEMKEFIKSNPGLHSRFNRYFHFEHYSPTELLKIFEFYCTKNDFILQEDAKEKLSFIVDKLYESRNEGFGNARTMRNLFEKIAEYQSTRLVKIENPTEADLKTIVEADIPEINKTVEDILAFTHFKTQKEQELESINAIKENFLNQSKEGESEEPEKAE